jgi:hypothetical protein
LLSAAAAAAAEPLGLHLYSHMQRSTGFLEGEGEGVRVGTGVRVGESVRM